MKLMAIDPGSKKSGFVIYSTVVDDVLNYGKIENRELINKFKDIVKNEKIIVLVEKPDYISTGIKINTKGKKFAQSAGSEVIDTIFWAGRMTEAFKAITYGRKFLKNHFSLKNDREVIAFIKTKYPHVKLKEDSWQAFLLVHAYMQDVI